MNEPRIAIIGHGGQGRTLADTILSKAIRNSEEIKLLQAYLDIGLAPEEIKDHEEMFKAYRYVCGGKPPEEIARIMMEHEAYSKKAGEKVYYVPAKNRKTCIERKVHEWYVITREALITWIDEGAIGVEIFLTREEAESALKGGSL